MESENLKVRFVLKTEKFFETEFPIEDFQSKIIFDEKTIVRFKVNDKWVFFRGDTLAYVEEL